MKSTQLNEAGSGFPSEGWRHALHSQLTPALLREAGRCAKRELGRLATLGVDLGIEADDLVQSTLTATCSGSVTWNPNAVPLLGHVIDVIRRYCRDQMRARRRRSADVRIDLDAVAEDHPVWAAVEDSLRADSGEPSPAIVDLASQLEDALRKLAEGDEVTLRVLEALPSGSTLPELVEATGLDVIEVRRARERLRWMARALPRALQERIRDVLHGANAGAQHRVQVRDVPTPASDERGAGPSAGRRRRAVERRARGVTHRAG